MWDDSDEIQSGNFCVPGWLFLNIPHTDTVGRKDIWIECVEIGQWERERVCMCVCVCVLVLQKILMVYCSLSPSPKKKKKKKNSPFYPQCYSEHILFNNVI